MTRSEFGQYGAESLLQTADRRASQLLHVWRLGEEPANQIFALHARAGHDDTGWSRIAVAMSRQALERKRPAHRGQQVSSRQAEGRIGLGWRMHERLPCQAPPEG